MNALHRTTYALALALGSLGTVPGCAAYRLETPTGFAQVTRTKQASHYKASDNVGLNVRTFDNVDGGTLEFWSEDLTTKLGRRGYTLEHHGDLRSANGVPGRRMDFVYRPSEDTEKAYAVVLFATDKHRVVVQLAGDPQPHARHSKSLDTLAREMKVRGCRPRSKICP